MTDSKKCGKVKEMKVLGEVRELVNSLAISRAGCKSCRQRQTEEAMWSDTIW